MNLAICGITEILCSFKVVSEGKQGEVHEDRGSLERFQQAILKTTPQGH